MFARAGKTDPPFRFILSQTLAGKAVGYVIESSSVRAVPLFVPDGRSFVPACACSGASRAGAVKAGRRAWLSTTSAFAGHALTAPSTVPRSRRLGRHRVCLGTFEVTSLVENRPGDAGELVGERDRQYVVV